MRFAQTRRHFATSILAAGAVSLTGSAPALADEGPPETTTVRLRFEDAPPVVVNGVADIVSCTAPIHVAEELLSAEGFTDVRYVPVRSGPAFSQAVARGEIDFAFVFAPGALRRLDAGVPMTVLAGAHPGCFELFAREHIRTVTDLKGKQVGISESLGSANHLYVSIMAAHVGLDPKKDIKWITTDDVANPMELFVQGEIDAYLAFVPEPRELHAGKIGHVIVDMARDKPWVNYYCCMIVGNTDYVRKYPVATKRALRAILKATDLCSIEPERAARRLVDSGFAQHYDVALQLLKDIPYGSWRELDPEDSLRFYALWLHEFGELNSTPNKIIAEGSDWRFLNEVKRELKA
jgi:NitT/TauT family transport system substrate-binding protein